jgi:tetratricopeptide (TPR) repeat protein
MKLFRWFFPAKPPASSGANVPAAVARIFDRQHEIMRGQQLTNDAISHQALGNTSKALVLVDKAVTQYRYAPAMTVKAKILVADNRIREAESWLHRCIAQLADKNLAHYDIFRNSLEVELFEQLGVIFFRSYGDLRQAVKYFLMGLNIEPPLIADQLRSTIYRELAHLYAVEGHPEEASKFCKLRLATVPDCDSCSQISRMVSGLERRPYDLQVVIDKLVEGLVALDHPQALRIPEPVARSMVYDAVVPVAFAWVCMQHKNKPHDFLSGPEVSLLTDRAVLAMAGAYRRSVEYLHEDPMHRGMQAVLAASLGNRGVRVSFGKDPAKVAADCTTALASVMNCIPVDDLFDGNERAIDCLASWAAAKLQLSRTHSHKLVGLLRTL